MCKCCTSWEHETDDCRFKGVCDSCNVIHVRGACALQHMANCAAVVKNIAKLCVQDIAISKGKSKANRTARVLFDLGSQATLVRYKFAELAGWSSTKADYTLAGIGASATLIKGRLWNVSLLDKNGGIRGVQGYGV